MKHVNRKIHDEKLRLKDHYKLAMLQLWFMGIFVTGLANKMERNINKITEHGIMIWTWRSFSDLMRCEFPQYGLHGREGCKARSPSLGQASSLKHHCSSIATKIRKKSSILPDFTFSFMYV